MRFNFFNEATKRSISFHFISSNLIPQAANAHAAAKEATHGNAGANDDPDPPENLSVFVPCPFLVQASTSVAFAFAFAFAIVVVVAIVHCVHCVHFVIAAAVAAASSNAPAEAPVMNRQHRLLEDPRESEFHPRIGRSSGSSSSSGIGINFRSRACLSLRLCWSRIDGVLGLDIPI